MRGWPSCTLYFAGANYGCRAKEKPDLAVTFFRSLTDKVKLVDPVKDRGNTNFKQLRFKAAIADYSTAIKLWYEILVTLTMFVTMHGQMFLYP